jgi:hypothetical protein
MFVTVFPLQQKFLFERNCAASIILSTLMYLRFPPMMYLQQQKLETSVFIKQERRKRERRKRERGREKKRSYQII